MKRGLARFWYRLKNQFLRKQPELREPPRFLRGSKGELRQVTTWVCHLYPHFFYVMQRRLSCNLLLEQMRGQTWLQSSGSL